MAGLALGGLILLAALALLAKGLRLQFRERRLLPRLLPASGRVTDQGSRTSRFVSTDAAGNQTERLDVDFVASYEYAVGGRIFAGKAAGPAPPFRADQMPPHTITVFYDRDDPSVSRLSRTRGDATGRGYVVFGAIAGVVALAVMLIANVYRVAELAGATIPE